MSHFTVLVIGPDPERQLAPFHEFECTGRDDEFVQNLDVTEECRQEFAASTITRLRDPLGGLHDPYADEFFREPTPEEAAAHHLMGTGAGNGISWHSKDWSDGRGYRPKVRHVPEGYTEIELPRSEVLTFTEFVRDWHGKEVVPFGQEPDLTGPTSTAMRY